MSPESHQAHIMTLRCGILDQFLARPAGHLPFEFFAKSVLLVEHRNVLPNGPDTQPHFEPFTAIRSNRLLTSAARLIASASG